MTKSFDRRNGTFDYTSFMRMMHMLKERGYLYEKFQDAALLLEKKQKFILLRHDVDVDLEKAYRMALIEQNLGIYATYFLMLRTDHYNIFSSKMTSLVKEIIECGHDIGLHVDIEAYRDNITIEEINYICRKEVEIIEKWFDIEISVLSFHRPNDLVLSGDPGLTSPLLHTYMPIFCNKIKYYADSRGLWRYGNPLESKCFKTGLPMQISIHPIWWGDTESDANKSLNYSLRKKQEDLIASFGANFSVFEYIGS